MLIRKIIVGPDYLKGMSYEIGQRMNKGIVITRIDDNSEKGGFDIWVSNSDKEILKYKSFTAAMPISVEYSIDPFLEEKA